MRTIIHINGTAKTISPGGVMNTCVSIKRHPIIYMRVISLTNQSSVSFFIHNGINTCVSIPAFIVISCYNICRYQKLSVLEEPHMLFGKADFHISISNLIFFPAVCSVCIFRCNGLRLSAFNCIQNLGGGIIWRNDPSIITARNGNILSICCSKWSGCPKGIIFIL